MTDPFERAAKIARGELDDEMPTVDELKQWMRRLPATSKPSLLRQAVAINAHTFASKGEFLTAVERWFVLANNPNSMLREARDE